MDDINIITLSNINFIYKYVVVIFMMSGQINLSGSH